MSTDKTLDIIASQTEVAALEAAKVKTYSGRMLDITAPEIVEVQIRSDGSVLWVNIDGICRLRACNIGNMLVNDERTGQDD
jgi:hypothetical protein